MTDDRSRLQEVGARVSDVAADFAAEPAVQVGFIVLCLAWFALRLDINVLSVALSVLAITLTQMVLNRQQERERDTHRRDVALHARLDELLLASRRARDEMAGVEELEVEEIEQLKKTGPALN